jgi:phosphoribosylanthranilate isomerase
MPQNIVTHAYNYKLDYIQLHGSESPIYIDNLRNTLVPDILPDIKIIKALSINEEADILKWKIYEGHVDMFLFDTKSTQTVGGTGKHFDWSLINMYDGNIPFLLSGGIGPDDAEAIKSFEHPMCVGIDLNSRFEKEPGIKDVDRLKAFLKALA